MSVIKREWGVRRHGQVEPISEHDANNAYMTSRQLAIVRAKAVSGTAVSRVITISYGDWAPVPGQPCMHDHVEPAGGRFRCLDCGELGPAHLSEEVAP